VALSFAVLDALARPRTVEELAGRLGVAPPDLRRELDRLERRGYVRRSDGAAGACGGCALRSGCASGSTERWCRT